MIHHRDVTSATGIHFHTSSLSFRLHHDSVISHESRMHSGYVAENGKAARFGVIRYSCRVCRAHCCQMMTAKTEQR